MQFFCRFSNVFLRLRDYRQELFGDSSQMFEKTVLWILEKVSFFLLSLATFLMHFFLHIFSTFSRPTRRPSSCTNNNVMAFVLWLLGSRRYVGEKIIVIIMASETLISGSSDSRKCVGWYSCGMFTIMETCGMHQCCASSTTALIQSGLGENLIISLN